MFKKISILLIIAVLLFSVSAMAGSLSKTARYESSGPFDIWILEVRDTTGTGFQSYDAWRYKSIDGHRYEIRIDYNRSSFYNCEPDPYCSQDNVVARQHGDWSWTTIKIVAKDRFKPWNYILHVKYERVR